jgi:hypothetical protein
MFVVHISKRIVVYRIAAHRIVPRYTRVAAARRRSSAAASNA